MDGKRFMTILDMEPIFMIIIVWGSFQEHGLLLARMGILRVQPISGISLGMTFGMALKMTLR